MVCAYSDTKYLIHSPGLTGVVVNGSGSILGPQNYLPMVCTGLVPLQTSPAQI